MKCTAFCGGKDRDCVACCKKFGKYVKYGFRRGSLWSYCMQEAQSQNVKKHYKKLSKED